MVIRLNFTLKGAGSMLLLAYDEPIRNDRDKSRQIYNTENAIYNTRGAFTSIFQQEAGSWRWAGEAVSGSGREGRTHREGGGEVSDMIGRFQVR